MLDAYHAAVFTIIANGVAAAVWDHVPNDIAEVPCVVVANPQARETSTKVVFDLSVDVFAVGRRQEAGGAAQEVRQLADQVWQVFNGTRAASSNGYVLTVRNLLPRVLSIAGLDCPAYSLTVDSSIATC